MLITTKTKQKLIEIFQNQQQKEIAALERAIEEAKQEAIKAPGRMEARYDVRKEEETQKHDSLQNICQEKISQLNQVKNLENKRQEEIIFGTLFQISDDRYFFVLVGGGKIIFENEEVVIMSPDAPIFEKIKGLKKGQSFSWPNGKKETIKEIV